MIEECRWLEGCALLLDLDPVGIHRSLRERAALHHPQLHSILMERAYDAMPACDVVQFDLGVLAQNVAEQDEWHAWQKATAADYIAQCESFRRNPGWFVPGAKPAVGVAFIDRSHAMDGWVELASGEVLPWAFAPGGVTQQAALSAAEYVARTIGVERCLVVGTHVRKGVTIPETVAFVPLAIDTATPSTGPEAA